MMTTAVILMSLVTTNSNAMSNLFALNYLKTQEKNKIQYFKKKQYENKRNLMSNNKKIDKTLIILILLKNTSIKNIYKKK